MAHSKLRRRPRASGIRRSSNAQCGDALWKLNPLTMARNPVMFVVEVGCVLRRCA